MRNTSIGIILKQLISITVIIGQIPFLWGQPNHDDPNQKETYVNRLAESSSPYLLQHKNNPVDWNAWNDLSLQRAEDENAIVRMPQAVNEVLERNNTSEVCPVYIQSSKINFINQ